MNKLMKLLSNKKLDSLGCRPVGTHAYWPTGSGVAETSLVGSRGTDTCPVALVAVARARVRLWHSSFRVCCVDYEFECHLFSCSMGDGYHAVFGTDHMHCTEARQLGHDATGSSRACDSSCTWCRRAC